MNDIVQDVAAVAQSIGLDVYGVYCPTFATCPMVYGPLDSIAILIDTFQQQLDRAPRRFRARRIRTQ